MKTLTDVSPKSKPMPNPILTIISDFDGVLAHDNTYKLLNACYGVINHYSSIEKVWFTELFKTLVPCPLHLSVSFLLESLDLLHIKNELFDVLGEIESDINSSLPFLDYCDSMEIPVYVLSTGAGQSKKYNAISERLGADKVIASPDLSKLHLETYVSLLKRLELDPSCTLYIDDCPAALYSAKQANLSTIMLTNRVFTEHDAKKGEHYIDWVYKNWEEVTEAINNRHNHSAPRALLDIG